MDDVFKALADASRRSLLDRLHVRNGQTLNDLCDGLAMTRQAVTKHLAILEAANLVTTFRHGREKLHYLNPVPIHQIGERWIRKFERGKPRSMGPCFRRDDERVLLRRLDSPHAAPLPRPALRGVETSEARPWRVGVRGFSPQTPKTNYAATPPHPDRI